MTQPKTTDPARRGAGRAIELFAGVGGFRLGLEKCGWQVCWSNQWEPSTKAQHASDCYIEHFGAEGHCNDNIAKVWDQAPEHDLLVGGFPCQDYSVAKTLSQSAGINGKKGVLWWEILRIIKARHPRFIFLENVDRLLKSPAAQRGRDFAIILACLSDLGYLVEWRVVNAAEYGFPQRRKRVFIVAEHLGTSLVPNMRDRMLTDGVLARSLPLAQDDQLDLVPAEMASIQIDGSLERITERFGTGRVVSPFRRAGVMLNRELVTRDVAAAHEGPFRTLGDVLQPADQIDPSFYVPRDQIKRWRYLKGAKHEPRTTANGHQWVYSEGAMTFDSPDRPSRTILTGEGGTSPSRFKHIISAGERRYRRLTPIELERLNGFPDDWTNTGMPDGRRAFMMGNALVVGLVSQVGRELASRMPQKAANAARDISAASQSA